MSFLSRKPARPDGRGRGDGYDDYADDGYAQSDDDGWSPNEYFSPEGIKGKWAGETPGGHSGGRGQREAGGPGRPSYGDDAKPAGYSGTGYEADEFGSGPYDLPDGADEDRGDRRRGRRSKDREDRGERTGILWLRRDRGEDIWPDDGISDEDYWASVAADRPLNAAPGGDDSPYPRASGSPLDDRPAPGGARAVDGSRPAVDPAARTGSRPGDDRRGVTGRLGPPPGLSADYKPGGGSPGGPGHPSRGARTASGPMPARPGTGPHPVRPGTGSTPTVGVTSSRPPAGPNGARTGPVRPESRSGGLPQATARPTFQPNGSRAGGLPSAAPGGGRQRDREERTERIERVTASGYPEPRPAGGRGPSGPLGPVPGSPGRPGTSGPLGALSAPGRGRSGTPDRRAPDRRAAGGESGRGVSGPWPTARGGASGRSDDDPLTSNAYSRAAMAETDGRSYRVAARRSQAQAKLTEQAETFIMGQRQQPAQAQPGRGGEYWRYRDDVPAPVPQSPGAWRPAPGDQGRPSPMPGRGQVSPGLAGPGAGGPAPAPGRALQPAFTPAAPGGPGLPGAGNRTRPGQPGGQYETRQRSAQPQLPSADLPAPAPSGGAGAAAATAPGIGRPAGAGGLNPYDSAVTGSYPYPGQPYPALPGYGPTPDGASEPYYRPSPTAGYPSDGYPASGQGRADQGRPGYGGYQELGDRRY